MRQQILDLVMQYQSDAINIDQFDNGLIALGCQIRQPGHYQWRITCNGEGGQHVFDVFPAEQWRKAAEMVDDRGGICTLHERLITDPTILPMLVDMTGYMIIKDKVVSPWTVKAEVEVR